MELTAADVRDAQFREKMRGYHPEDVDEFLERVATAIDTLHIHLREVAQRAEQAEQRVRELVEQEESVQRTLVLAQRTADAAVQEARAEAQRLIDEATGERDRLVAETEELRVTLAADAQASVRAEVEQLMAARDQLHADVGALQQFAEQARNQIAAVLRQQLDAVESGSLSTGEAPAATPVDVPPAPAAAGRGAADEQPPTEAMDVVAPAGEGAAAVQSGAEEVHDASGEDETGPGEDVFLAELRRAMTDESPLGPGPDEADDDDVWPRRDDADDDHADLFGPEGGRFASRLRRRR